MKTQHSDYDPRVRPWYVEATKKREPALTEPYLFAQSNAPGISAGVPMRDGAVIGLDFTLGPLSRLLGAYKVTPNSIIMVATDTSDVFIESGAVRGFRRQLPAGRRRGARRSPSSHPGGTPRPSAY